MGIPDQARPLCLLHEEAQGSMVTAVLRWRLVGPPAHVVRRTALSFVEPSLHMARISMELVLLRYQTTIKIEDADDKRILQQSTAHLLAPDHPLVPQLYRHGLCPPRRPRFPRRVSGCHPAHLRQLALRIAGSRIRS